MGGASQSGEGQLLLGQVLKVRVGGELCSEWGLLGISWALVSFQGYEVGQRAHSLQILLYQARVLIPVYHCTVTAPVSEPLCWKVLQLDNHVFLPALVGGWSQAAPHGLHGAGSRVELHLPCVQISPTNCHLTPL